MLYKVRIHFDNSSGFREPYLWSWCPGAPGWETAPSGEDSFGIVYDLETDRPGFSFKFKEGPGRTDRWEGPGLERDLDPDYSRSAAHEAGILNAWCRGDKAFVYYVEPRAPEIESAGEFLRGLSFAPGQYVSGTGGFSGLGANVLSDGRVLFGLYHPNAARVYLVGDFNEWRRPGSEAADGEGIIEMKLYRGYFGRPNIWLTVTDLARAGSRYKFFISGGVPKDDKSKFHLTAIDPYARRLDENDFKYNTPVVLDPSSFVWTDDDWKGYQTNELILYEMSVYGFTERDLDIQPENQGTFRGITERIGQGYFDNLGVTALCLMPLVESPSMQGPTTLGYDPSIFCTVERDFGSPDDLRDLVNEAHRRRLAVILDQVFNHTSNSFNPLWRIILEHPREPDHEGGLYFNGSTDWGNRLATEKTDVQNMLIDACKLLIREYHVDGFRFDATHSRWMDHGFLHRLAAELEGFKPGVHLIAENLPNENDLNRNGYDGFAQWNDFFHDKMKALLREGTFEHHNHYNAENLGDIFFFSKQGFASHTNNVVNYCESHDEHSIPYEIKSQPFLNDWTAKDRKGRLGLFATMTALGQPMIYMGQEFNEERERNHVTVQWPVNLNQHGFFQWARRVVHLRRRYPGLRLEGYNPAEGGQFTWIMGPWFDERRGGGRLVVGWRSHPNDRAHDSLVVMLNFEKFSVTVDVEFGVPGTWVKLADINSVNDTPPFGTNSALDPTAVHTLDGNFGGFSLPGSSAFLYKWEAPLP